MGHRQQVVRQLSAGHQEVDVEWKDAWLIPDMLGGESPIYESGSHDLCMNTHESVSSQPAGL